MLFRSKVLQTPSFIASTNTPGDHSAGFSASLILNEVDLCRHKLRCCKIWEVEIQVHISACLGSPCSERCLGWYFVRAGLGRLILCWKMGLGTQNYMYIVL